MGHPRAGVHYPRSVGELQAWLRTDADCVDYLEWLVRHEAPVRREALETEGGVSPPRRVVAAAR
ncbi:MAG: hypothetical protein GEU78_19505 [Actinobacteria bacterium]|nr:hypothetical protein [Actinomycetota bacterium]